MEMTVCAMKPWQTLPDLTPHPLHSLRYPTGDISGPSIAKLLLLYSECKGVGGGGVEEWGVGAGPYAERESATTRAPSREKEYNCIVKQRENMWDAAVEQRRVHLQGEIDH